jgi:site-specific DNA recombinase
MRAVLYVRVSTDKQVEKYGIPSQIEALRKRCLERGWDLLFDGDRDVFIDDGYSGAELDRPALNRLRKIAREGKADIVLSYDPDRLSRKLYHQMILAEEFEKQGIKLEFITQEMGTSPEDRMFFNMRGLVAEYEREKIRERTLRGRREKARQGKVVSSGSVPLGFRYNKEKATFEENPETAQMLRLIFYTFANESLSLQCMADRLNRLHVPTPGRGSRWRASTSGNMLRNEVYIGNLYQFRKYMVEPKRRRKIAFKSRKTSSALRPKEEWITVRVSPLIPEELFEAVQRKLRSNAERSRRNTKREYLLSGLLYCAQCGGRMGGHTIRGITYYRCFHKRNGDMMPMGLNGKLQLCSCPEVKADSVETVVWDTVLELVKDPDFLIKELHRRNSNSSNTKEVLQRELQLCDARLKVMPDEQRRLVGGYRKGLYADFMMREEMETLQKEQAELKKRKEELERQLTQRFLTDHQEAQIRDLVKSISTGLNHVDFAGRQELLRLLVEKVIYSGQNIEIQTIIPPLEQLHPMHREGIKG